MQNETDDIFDEVKSLSTHTREQLYIWFDMVRIK